MHTLQTLIDAAAEMCGSDAELARRLGKHRAQVCDMRAGREPISPETVALLCDVLQLDGQETRYLAAVAIVERTKDEARRQKLRRAFFVSLGLGAAWALWLLGNVPSDSVTALALVTYFPFYTLCALLLAAFSTGTRYYSPPMGLRPIPGGRSRPPA